jgi:aryl-alcohol dehydrogenase-like predicted oxidoreductase
MKENQNKTNRRNFLKTIGAAGLGSVIASVDGIAAESPTEPAAKTQKSESQQVPKRKLGKTDVEVSCLSLGGDFSFLDKQIVLIKAFESGVTYWDTAHNYGGGNAELGIGRFLSKNPDARKKLFIVSKPAIFRGPVTAEKVEERLHTSLERMNTEYVDLYYAYHGLSDPALLTDEIKQWTKSAKKRNLIRFFGFSTHKNMAQCLAAAARLDWIDAITTLYNFRTMQDPEMQAAVEACHKAGIGLTCMKAFSRGVRRLQPVETEQDKKLLAQFQNRGFSEEQAKIKVVLQDNRFSAVCIGMQNISLLNTNIDAVMNKAKLTQADIDALKEYARATCGNYCTGCAHICDSAMPNTPYVSDIMRYLMYCNSYGDRDRARKLFAQIPARVRSRLLGTDYSFAEARCPQHLQITKLVAEAVHKLS